MELPIMQKFKSNNNFEVMQDQLICSMLEELWKIISNTKSTIREQLKQQCDAINENTKDIRIDADDFLNNELLQNIIYLLVKVSKFDLFKMIKRLEFHPQFVRELFGLLEYDKANPVLSYLLTTTRNANFERISKENKKNKMFAAFTSVVGNVADLGKGLANIVTSTVFGKKKERKAQKMLDSETEDPKVVNNPLMKGLLTLVRMIDVAVKGEEVSTSATEIKIKTQIAEILLDMTNQRQDFLIQNFLCWFDEILIKEGRRLFGLNPLEIRENLLKHINAQSLSVIPATMKTGIPEVDEKYAAKTASMNLLSGVKTLVKKAGKNKILQISSFTNYTNNEEFPDLDRLIKDTNVLDSKQKGMEALPSLLATFVNANNTKLEHYLLDVIMKAFSQKEELGTHLKQLDVLFEEEDIQVYNRIKTQIDETRFLVERSEIWLAGFALKGEKQAEAEEMIYQINQLKGLLFKQKNTSTNFKSPPSERNPLHRAIMRQRGIDAPTVDPCEIHQNIFRNLKGHIPILELLRNGMFHLKRAYREHSPQERKEKLKQIFEGAYECLTLFCKNNEINQSLLCEKFKLFLLNIDFDLGQIALICEICKNNKSVCEKYGKQIIDSMVEVIEKTGRKASYLQPLHVLQMAKGAPLFDNQMEIFNKLLPNFRSLSHAEQELLYTKERETMDLIFQFKTSEILTNSVPGALLPVCDEPGAYHSKLLDIFLLIAKGNEKLQFSHARLRKAFSLPYLLELLANYDLFDEKHLQFTDQEIIVVDENTEGTNNKLSLTGFKNEEIEWPAPEQMSQIKNKIIELIQVIYLNSDSRILREWDRCQESLGSFLVFEHKRLATIDEKNPQLSYYLSYLFDTLLPFLNTYVEKILNNSHIVDMDNTIDIHLFKNIVTVALEKISSLSRFFKEVSVENLTKLAKGVNDEQAYISLLKEKIAALEHKKNEFVELEETIISIKKSRTEMPSQNKESVKNIWQRLLQVFLSSKVYEEEVEKEGLALSDAIVNFDQYLPPETMKKYKLRPITLKEIVKKFIRYLRHGLSDNANVQTMIKTAKMLINIVKNAANKKLIQDFMDKEEAMEMILSVFSDVKYPTLPGELLDVFLKFGITLLDGGNNNVQKTIYAYCISMPRSEFMFKRFYTLIQDQIHELKSQDNVLIADNFENDNKFMESFCSKEFEELDNKDEDFRSKILENLLRFLQLFTEGHYLELQNYVRFQKNNSNSFDLVSIMSELLLAYSSRMAQKDYENVIKCLDTLTEFVQGPCPDNQVALIDGKFLEVAYKILSKETKKIILSDLEAEEERLMTTQSSHTQPLPFVRRSTTKPISQISVRTNGKSSEMLPWQIAQLKYKTMILVNSLWESKQTPKRIGRIMRSIPLDVLKQNIAEIYKQYKDQYDKTYTVKAFGHYASNPDDDEGKKPPDHYELIIETGFYIYFLIQTYIEANVQDSDIDFLDEIHELNEELRATKSIRGANGLLNNVVGDLGKFGVTLLTSSLSTVSSVTKSVEKNLKNAIKFKLIRTEEEKKALKEAMELKNALEYKGRIKEGLEFFAKNSAHIEVVRNKNIEKVQFILMPYHTELPKEFKTQFHEKVDRISLKSKITGLIETTDSAIKVAKHELSLKVFFAKNKFIAVFANFVHLWKDLAFILSIVLNIFILFSYSSYFTQIGQSPRYARTHTPVFFLDPASYTPQETTLIFHAMGIAMLLCSSFVFVFFILKKLPVLLKEIWVDPPGAELQKKGVIKHTIKFISRTLRTIFAFAQSFEILYYIGYIIFAIIGMTYHNFFFAYHLLEVTIRFPTLKNVLRSLWEPRKAILLLILLVLITEYVFSCFAFEFLSADFDGYCDSMIVCFVSNIDFTFKGNGGVGGYLTAINIEDSSRYYNAGRFIFDYLATMLLTVLMISILAGIIISTFGSLREKEEEKVKDIRDLCFICGHSREIFERQADTSIGFTTHIKLDHYMWNYAFYIEYIRTKDPTEYTGMESYIREKLDRGDITWFPLHRALSLKGTHQTGQANYQKIYNNFQEDLVTIKSDIKQMTDTFSKFSEEYNFKFDLKETFSGLSAKRTLSKNIGS